MIVFSFNMLVGSEQNIHRFAVGYPTSAAARSLVTAPTAVVLRKVERRQDQSSVLPQSS